MKSIDGNQLKKLSRVELLELLVEQGEQLESTQEKLAVMEARAAHQERIARLAEDAAARLSGILEAAQLAQAQYMQNLRELKAQMGVTTETVSTEENDGDLKNSALDVDEKIESLINAVNAANALNTSNTPTTTKTVSATNTTAHVSTVSKVSTASAANVTTPGGTVSKVSVSSPANTNSPVKKKNSANALSAVNAQSAVNAAAANQAQVSCASPVAGYAYAAQARPNNYSRRNASAGYEQTYQPSNSAAPSNNRYSWGTRPAASYAHQTNNNPQGGCAPSIYLEDEGW